MLRSLAIPHPDADDEHPESRLRRIAERLALIEAQRAELQRALAAERRHVALIRDR